MTLRSCVQVLLLAVASCHRAPPAPPAPAREECSCTTPPRVERPPSRPGVVDVTGAWEVVGSAAAAAVTRCEPGYRDIPKGADFHDRSLALIQRAARVELWAESDSITHRGTVRSETRRCEQAEGALEGPTLHLSGQECLQSSEELQKPRGIPSRGPSKSSPARARPVAYVLALEADTGHLVGSRNGAPIRLAPVTFVRSGPPCQSASAYSPGAVLGALPPSGP